MTFHVGNTWNAALQCGPVGTRACEDGEQRGSEVGKEKALIQLESDELNVSELNSLLINMVP